jgi:hypothetical protein
MEKIKFNKDIIAPTLSVVSEGDNEIDLAKQAQDTLNTLGYSSYGTHSGECTDGIIKLGGKFENLQLKIYLGNSYSSGGMRLAKMYPVAIHANQSRVAYFGSFTESQCAPGNYIYLENGKFYLQEDYARVNYSEDGSHIYENSGEVVEGTGIEEGMGYYFGKRTNPITTELCTVSPSFLNSMHEMLTIVPSYTEEEIRELDSYGNYTWYTPVRTEYSFYGMKETTDQSFSQTIRDLTHLNASAIHFKGEVESLPEVESDSSYRSGDIIRIKPSIRDITGERGGFGYGCSENDVLDFGSVPQIVSASSKNFITRCFTLHNAFTCGLWETTFSDDMYDSGYIKVHFLRNDEEFVGIDYWIFPDGSPHVHYKRPDGSWFDVGVGADVIRVLDPLDAYNAYSLSGCANQLTMVIQKDTRFYPTFSLNVWSTSQLFQQLPTYEGFDEYGANNVTVPEDVFSLTYSRVYGGELSWTKNTPISSFSFDGSTLSAYSNTEDISIPLTGLSSLGNNSYTTDKHAEFITTLKDFEIPAATDNIALHQFMKYLVLPVLPAHNFKSQSNGISISGTYTYSRAGIAAITEGMYYGFYSSDIGNEPIKANITYYQVDSYGSTKKTLVCRNLMAPEQYYGIRVTLKNELDGKEFMWTADGWEEIGPCSGITNEISSAELQNNLATAISNSENEISKKLNNITNTLETIGKTVETDSIMIIPQTVAHYTVSSNTSEVGETTYLLSSSTWGPGFAEDMPLQEGNNILLELTGAFDNQYTPGLGKALVALFNKYTDITIEVRKANEATPKYSNTQKYEVLAKDTINTRTFTQISDYEPGAGWESLKEPMSFKLDTVTAPDMGCVIHYVDDLQPTAQDAGTTAVWLQLSNIITDALEQSSPIWTVNYPEGEVWVEGDTYLSITGQKIKEDI